MKKLYERKDMCCGCAVCMTVCNRKAICMEPDEEGFFYPSIDTNKCVDCGMCMAICPMHGTSGEKNVKMPVIYAACNKNESVRNFSQSGGLFSALSDVVLAQGGVIYGAAFEKNLTVAHRRAETKAERDVLRGSKYVQSDLQTALPMISNDLAHGKVVLFSGTPCQCAGVGNLFQNNKNLFLCDVICHGTPSPMLWTDYLYYMQKRHGQFPDSAVFRNKMVFGWHSHVETLEINNKAYNDTIYSALYYGHNPMRPCCYQCQFSRTQRPSDITMGDFWGIEDSLPDFPDDNKGVSIALINTNKGVSLFEAAASELTTQKCEKINYQKQPHLQTPVPCPASRNEFWKDYRSYGFAYVANKYSCAGLPKSRSDVKALLIKYGLYRPAKWR